MSRSIFKVYFFFGLCLVLSVASQVCFSQSVTLKGRVTSEQGQTPPNPKVVLTGKNVRREANVNPATGEFRIERVPRGIFNVAACAGTSYVPQIQENVEVKDGKSPPFIELTLSYADERNKPLSGPFKKGKGIDVSALAYECEVARTKVNEQGRYEFKDLPRPPKDYRVATVGRDGRILTSALIPMADQGTEVTLSFDIDKKGLEVGLIAQTFTPVQVVDPGAGITGELAGRVSDASGAVAPGAKVRVTNRETGASLAVTTNDQGDYRLEVSPGNYHVEVEATGFKVSRLDNILVASSQSMNVDVTLDVGEVSSAVTVTEGQPETSTDAAIAMTHLPLGGRPVLELLLPGAGQVNPLGIAGSVSGLRPSGVNITLDGIQTNDTLASTTLSPVGLSSVGEFRFSPTGFQSVQLNKSPGDQIDIITRSGGNEFHGGVDYQIMNDALDAHNFFSLPGFDTFRQHTGSAKVGGPIRKYKLYFFANYELERKAEAPTFSTILSSQVPALNQQLRRLGLPAEDLRRFVTTSASDSPLLRLDYNINEFNSLAMIYSFRRSLIRKDLTSALDGTSSTPSTARDISDRNHLLSLRYTWTISPTLVSESLYKYQSNSTTLDPLAPAEPSIFIPGLALLGRATSLIEGDGHTYISHLVSERITIVSGNHRMDVGGYFDFNKNLFRFAAFESGRVVIPSLVGLSSNIPTVDLFQLGRGGSQVRFNFSKVVLHFQDEFRVNRDLSITFGLRYKLELPPSPKQRDTRGLQPRVSFAWDIFGNQDTVLRAGYTLHRSFLPPLPLGFQLLMGGQGLQPIEPVRRVISFTGQQLASSAFNQFLTNASIPTGPQLATTYDPPSHSPIVHAFDLSLVRNLGRRILLDISYSHRRGMNLLTSTNVNLPPPIQINGRFDFRNASVNPNFAQIYQFETAGHSSYHGGTLTVFRNLSSGLSFNAAYTFSKAIDDVPSLKAVDVMPTGSFEATPENVFDRRSERAISSWNPTHKFSTWGLWEVPDAHDLKSSNIRRALGTLFFSGKLLAESGGNFNVLVGSDANHDGNPLTDRPLTVGRNTFLGQSRFQLDARVGSNIRLTDNQRVRLSIQIFNVLNRTNFASYNTVLGQSDLSGLDPRIVSGRRGLQGFDFRRPLTSSGFGLATSTSGPRRVQLEISYQF